MWVKIAWPLDLSESLAALTVTVCAVSQSAVVKVSVAGLAVRSASPPDCFATLTVTGPVGKVSSTTVQVAVSPSVTDNDGGSTLTPAVSSSSSVAVTGSMLMPL